MCGISGIWQRDGQVIDTTVLDRMTDALAHRGPDGRGTWVEQNIGLGHRRLAIRDLSELGRQPIADPSGRIMVTFNGEIYNDRELADELARDFGLIRRGHSDSEIIPLGFAAWGPALFERLEGMFAIALWDGANQRLYLARDAAGIKPLYVFENPDQICFASELKGLLAHPAVPRRVEASALSEYLALGYSAPGRCLLAGVEELPPATVRCYDLAGQSDTRYWQPRRSGEIRRLDEACEAVGETLSRVVSDMLVSDVPVGVLQSGGIDSTLIACALGKRDFPLFTASFEGASHDESVQAGAVARLCERKHNLVPVDTGTDAPEVFREMVKACDGQLADSSAFAVLLLSRAIRSDVTVALSGDGADEFFGGYPTYRATRLAGRIAPVLPAGLLRTLGRLCLAVNGGSSARYPVNEVAGRFLLGAAHGSPQCHAAWRQLTTPEDVAALLRLAPADVSRTGLGGYASVLLEQSAGNSATDAALLADQGFYLPGDMLQKVDRMSMASSLEIRVPFLDRRMMDLAGRIDLRLLTPRLPPDKRVLRSLAARWGAPKGIVGAPKKGFNLPLANLLRGPLRQLGDHYLDRRADALEEMLDPTAVRRLWASHVSGKRNHGYAVWSLLVFGLWYNEILREDHDGGER